MLRPCRENNTTPYEVPMKSCLSLAVLTSLLLALLATCGTDRTPDAAAAVNAVYERETAAQEKATTAVAGATDAQAVIAAIALHVAARQETDKELQATAAKFADVADEKLRAATKTAAARCAQARDAFQTAFTRLDTKLLSEDAVIQAMARM